MGSAVKRSATIQIRLLPSTKKIAQRYAQEQRRSLTNFIEQLILDFGEQKEKRGEK